LAAKKIKWKRRPKNYPKRGIFRHGMLDIREDSEYLKRMKRARQIVYIILVISLAIFAVIAAFAIYNEGVSNFINTISSINLYYYLLSFLVLFFAYMLRYPKWEMYLNTLGVKVSRWTNIAVYLSMYSMDITPGRWGRGVVSYTLNRITGSKFATTFPAVVADIFTDFLGFGILAIISAFLVQKYVVTSIVITGILLLPFFFLYVKRPFEYIKEKFGHWKRFQVFWDLGELYFQEKTKLGTRDYLVSIIYTLPSVVLTGLALYFVILAFNIHIGLAQMPEVMFIYSSSLLFGIITGAPATLGVTDALLVGYLTLFFPDFGITFGIAAAITIFFRIVSVWFVQVFGSAALFYTMRRWELPRT
jgi:glycosyltransferase 2 family protein